MATLIAMLRRRAFATTIFERALRVPDREYPAALFESGRAARAGVGAVEGLPARVLDHAQVVEVFASSNIAVGEDPGAPETTADRRACRWSPGPSIEPGDARRFGRSCPRSDRRRNRQEIREIAVQSEVVLGKPRAGRCSAMTSRSKRMTRWLRGGRHSNGSNPAADGDSSIARTNPGRTPSTTGTPGLGSPRRCRIGSELVASNRTGRGSDSHRRSTEAKTPSVS